MKNPNKKYGFESPLMVFENPLLESYQGKQTTKKDLETMIFFKQLLADAPRPAFITDEEDNVVYINKSAEALLGYGADRVFGVPMAEILFEPFEEQASARQEEEGRLRSKTGKKIPVLVAKTIRKIENRSYNFIFCTDISRQKAREKKLKSTIETMRMTSETLRKLVKTDALTGLLNRRGLEELLTREIELSKRNGSNLVAALIDLDDFKSINSRFGHAGGDIVLKNIAGALESCLRSSDWVGRVGGDEFMVFLPDTSYTEAISIAERMRASVAALNIHKNKEKIEVTTSTGLAKLSTNTKSLQEVMEHVRESLEQSKNSGKNQVSASKFGTKVKAIRKPKIEEILLSKERYSVECQPIYNLTTGEVHALELFSRGPARELYSPEVFFQIARENKLIDQVDRFCFENCIEYAEKIENDLIIHINIFPETLESMGLEEILQITAKLRERHTLCLELCGTSNWKSPENLATKLNALTREGILICLDDVCSGSCTIEALTILEPHCVKLDRSMVADLVQDPHKICATGRLMKMIRALDCLVITEGVELEDEYVALRRLDILYGQGRLWDLNKRPASKKAS